MDYLSQFTEVNFQINQAIELTLYNMRNQSLPWKRVRTIGFEFKLKWISEDMVGVAGVLTPKGNLPLCKTTPFNIQVFADESGKLRVVEVTKEEAERENFNPDQSDMFARTNGAAAAQEEEAEAF